MFAELLLIWTTDELFSTHFLWAKLFVELNGENRVKFNEHYFGIKCDDWMVFSGKLSYDEIIAPLDSTRSYLALSSFDFFPSAFHLMLIAYQNELWSLHQIFICKRCSNIFFFLFGSMKNMKLKCSCKSQYKITKQLLQQSRTFIIFWHQRWT